MCLIVREFIIVLIAVQWKALLSPPGFRFGQSYANRESPGTNKVQLLWFDATVPAYKLG